MKDKYFFHHLNSRFFEISGKDSKSFIQNLITNDIEKCNNGSIIYSCLLTPQGKFLADFFIFNINENYIFETNDKFYSNLLGRLKIYKLRSDIEIKEINNLYSYSLFNIDYKNLLSAYEQDVSRWRGYIDSLIFRDGYVIAKGWLVSVFSADLSEVILSVNGNRFLSSSISRHQRLDVFRGVEFSDENAGLEICFKVDDKIQTLKNMEIKIHIENNGFNNIFSLNKGISIR